MIGCEFLHNISNAITEAKGNTAALGREGGTGVISSWATSRSYHPLAMCIFTRMRKNVDTKGSMGATNWVRVKVLGRLPWLSVEAGVVPMWWPCMGWCVSQVLRTHNSSSSYSAYEYVCVRQPTNQLVLHAYSRTSLTKVASPIDYQWRPTPAIVINNVLRDIINRRVAEASTDRTRGELHGIMWLISATGRL